jgi:ADP-ribosylglycohydrolase
MIPFKEEDPMEPQELKNRCVGTIAGFAIGDALGMPVGFLSREQIRSFYGEDITCYRQAPPGHANAFLSSGSYTDNSQMLLATAECLIECGKMDPARQAEFLLSWYENTVPHRSPSGASINACKHLSAGKPWNKSGVFSCEIKVTSRMPPIGLFYCRDPQMLTRASLDNCSITHNEPRAKAACVFVAYLVARLVHSDMHSRPADQVLDAADHISHMDRDLAGLLQWTTEIVDLSPREALFEIGTSCDVLEALPAAVYCFLKYPRNFSEAIVAAVNAGDATDAIGALTGCFVGALTGASGIDSRWLAGIENPELLKGTGECLANLLNS